MKGLGLDWTGHGLGLGILGNDMRSYELTFFFFLPILAVGYCISLYYPNCQSVKYMFF